MRADLDFLFLVFDALLQLLNLLLHLLHALLTRAE